MKQITSTDFQKTYQRLTEPHTVTALGRPIGTWYPAGTDPSQNLRVMPPATAGSYSSRPFTPAPKPSEKKK